MRFLPCLVLLILVVASNTATTTSVATSTSTSTSAPTTTTTEPSVAAAYLKVIRKVVSLIAKAAKLLAAQVKPIFEDFNEKINGVLQYLSDVDNMILPDYDHLVSLEASIMTLLTTIPLIKQDIKQDMQNINKTQIIEAMQRVLGRILESRFAKYD
ncbi:unnamed protein product [Caenorhabditis angaria]|uniref:SXP/RAL-2 family protein Ani s 5-like cation-binding domain-containing protein n=1 Tax=Caenorhabditis angaria TaxID=860376 RepID=A0A9P1IEB8_9PELO|nr:unnamed protein product [Caenorhabditis angaria]